MAHSHQEQHTHWSGYGSNIDYFGSSPNNYGYGRPASRSPAPPALLSPRSPSSPSPIPSLSSSPQPKDPVAQSPSSSGHSSRKLDYLFKHLVKWGSPHKDKDKEKKHSGSPVPSPSTPSSGSTSSSSNSAKDKSSTKSITTNPIAVGYQQRPHYYNHYHSKYDDYIRRRSDDYEQEQEDDEDDENEYDEEEGEDISELLGATPPSHRTRSKSLDVTTRPYTNRPRRLSEGVPVRRRDSAQSTHKTYTIYESTTNDGARRSSLHSHRPSDVSLDPAHAAILFRDSRGLPAADPFLERICNLSVSVDEFGVHDLNQIRDFEETDDVREANRLICECEEDEENEILVKFFKFHKCYDLIPTSAKLVVFDTQLLVKKAFFALVYNGVRAAPLWDSDEKKFVGMLTITDFIKVLHAMYHDSAGSGAKMSELEEHRVDTWRRRFLLNKQPIISIDPDSSLYDAICSLVNNRIHRLPVIDKHTGNVLHILTHKRILKFLFLYIHEIPRPSFLNRKLREVKIGSFENIETAREDTPIIMALQKFLDKRVSALPIVDDQNRLIDIYARFDVINLAAEKTYNNLDISLKEANEHRNEWFEGVHKCTLDESLFIIMERIVKAEVHRLVVVDEEDRVLGVISLSDILEYLVMRPEIKEVSMTEIEEAMKKSIKGDGIELENGKAALILPESTIDNKNNFHRETSAEDSSNSERDNPTIFEEDEKTHT